MKESRPFTPPNISLKNHPGVAKFLPKGGDTTALLNNYPMNPRLPRTMEEGAPVNLDLTTLVDVATVAGLAWTVYTGVQDRRDARSSAVDQGFNSALLNLTKPDTQLAGITTLHDFLQKERKDYYELIFMHTVELLRQRDITNDDPKYKSFYRGIVSVFIRCAPLLSKKLHLEDLAKKADRSVFIAFRKASFNASGTKFDGDDLEGADLSYLNLEGASFAPLHINEIEQQVAKGEKIDDEDPRTTKLYKVKLIGADLAGADLRYVYASDIDLSRARLRTTKLQGAKLNQAIIEEARLEGSNLKGASLKRSKLKGAEFRNADLSEANLEGANPEEAKTLEGTKMLKVKNYPKQGDPGAQRKIQLCKDKGAIFDDPADSPNHLQEVK